WIPAQGRDDKDDSREIVIPGLTRDP
ncbi:MAG: hypothetical protein JWQ33_2745, partial [Ramlibacter sp.]|nr:hypothetical protein [Ramlibacter sp.]